MNCDIKKKLVKPSEMFSTSSICFFPQMLSTYLITSVNCVNWYLNELLGLKLPDFPPFKIKRISL